MQGFQIKGVALAKGLDEIRSFGIPYTELKTSYKFSSFELNEDQLELSIRGTNYEFCI